MAIRWGIVTANPCQGVKRNPERRRDHYVEDTDFDLMREAGSGLIRGMLNLGLLTGLRKGDLLDIRLQDLQAEGLYVEINKSRRLGGPVKKVLFEWTPELRRVVEEIRALPRPVRGMHLFCTRKGQPYSEDGFDSIWQRAARKLVAANPDFVRFQFNDIRHKAATDAERRHDREFARRLLGHADQKTTAIYISGVQRVKPLR